MSGTAGLNSFQEIQMLSLMQETSSVVDTRKLLNKIVEHFESRPFYEEQLTFFSGEGWRQLKPDTLKKARSFMVPDDYAFNELPEELQHESLGFCRESHIVFSGRYVYPIFDVKGDVAGFVGYDKFEEPKYIDSRNYGYKAKTTMLAGMQNMEQIYSSNEPVFVTEGYVCKLWLEEQGLLSLASLGAYISPYEYTILRRLGNRVVLINDNDQAGTRARKRSQRELPKALIVQPTLAKDIDDMRKVEGINVQEMLTELKQLAKNPFIKRKYFK